MGVVTTLDQRSGNFIAKVVYDDGFGRAVTLKKSISSIKEDAVTDVIYASGLLFLLSAHSVK
jgi:hypothetical protein